MIDRNPIEPQDRFQRATYHEDKQTIAQSLEAISKKHSISRVTEKSEGVIQRTLSRFYSFKEYNYVFLYDSFELTKNNKESFLVILSINSTVKVVSRHHRDEELAEFEFIGLTTLKKDYGKVFIRPETFEDKLNEIFQTTEVDFDTDKVFSRRYFVMTKDEEKLRKQVTPEFLSAIRKHKDLEIEIDGRDMMVRLRKRVSAKAAQAISELLMEINNGKN